MKRERWHAQRDSFFCLCEGERSSTAAVPLLGVRGNYSAVTSLPGDCVATLAMTVYKRDIAALASLVRNDIYFLMTFMRLPYFVMLSLRGYIVTVAIPAWAFTETVSQ